MRTRTPRTSRQDTQHDVGTLWTMERQHHKARCALMQWPAGWELRVVAGGETLLTEHCTHPLRRSASRNDGNGPCTNGAGGRSFRIPRSFPTLTIRTPRSPRADP